MLPTRTSALTAFNLPLRFAGLKSSDYVCCNDGGISTGPHEIWHIEYRHIYVQYPSTTERAPCWFSYPQYQVLRLRARKNLRPVVFCPAYLWDYFLWMLHFWPRNSITNRIYKLGKKTPLGQRCPPYLCFFLQIWHYTVQQYYCCTPGRMQCK